MEIKYNNERLLNIASEIRQSLENYRTFNKDDSKIDPIIQMLIEESVNHNPWFIKEHVVYGLESLALDMETIVAIGKPVATNFRSVGVILKTQVPFEGYAEIIYLAMQFGEVIVNIPQELYWHFEKFIALISRFLNFIGTSIEINKKFRSVDFIVSLSPLSGAINEYFRKFPLINLYSKGVCYTLTGNENDNETEMIAERCCINFGRGGANIKLLYLNRGFDIIRLAPFFEKFSNYHNHHRFFSNYEYRKSAMILNKVDYTELTPFLLTQDLKHSGFIGVICTVYNENEKKLLFHENFEFYELNTSELKNRTNFNRNIRNLKSFIENGNYA